MNLERFKRAFKYTIPILCGYAFLGFVYGVLMSRIGIHPLICGLFSLLIYGGSIQYALVPLIASQANLFSVFVLSISINLRHIFYGLSSLSRYEKFKWSRPYYIFTLSDETFGLVNALEAKDEDLLFYIHFLNHSYWVIFSFLGALFGSQVNVSLKGLDFSLTALFAVMFLNQLIGSNSRTYALLGLFISLCTLLIFKDNFIIWAMIFMVLALLVPFKKGGGQYE